MEIEKNETKTLKCFIDSKIYLWMYLTFQSCWLQTKMLIHMTYDSRENCVTFTKFQVHMQC